MLGVLVENLEKHEIMSYWHKSYNLLGHYDQPQLDALKNNFKKIQNQLIKHLNNNNVDYFLQILCKFFFSSSVLRLNFYFTLYSNTRRT